MGDDMANDEGHWSEDPNIKAALKEREPSDVYVISCPRCGRHGYYNQGSHFYCRHCDAGFFAAVEEELETIEDGRPFVMCEDAISVADLIDAECDPTGGP